MVDDCENKGEMRDVDATCIGITFCDCLRFDKNREEDASKMRMAKLAGVL